MLGCDATASYASDHPSGHGGARSAGADPWGLRLRGGETTNLIGGLGTAGLLVLILLAVSAYAYLAWTRLQFFYDDDGDLRITSGIVVRNERRVQLSRLQSVDVTQPLLARLFGLAELRPDVAGASSEKTTLRYLSIDDAQQLRAELLAKCCRALRGQAERHGADGSGRDSGPGAVSAPACFAHPAADARCFCFC